MRVNQGPVAYASTQIKFTSKDIEFEAEAPKNEGDFPAAVIPDSSPEISTLNNVDNAVEAVQNEV